MINKLNFFIKMLVMCLGGLLGMPAFAQKACGDVTIASMSWQSAEFNAQLDKFILSKGYGCDVDIFTGDTITVLTSMMEKGKPEIAPEVWTNAVPVSLIERGIKEKRIAKLSKILKDNGREGWVIPEYISKKYNITTIEQALKHPDLFPAPEDSKKGGIYGAPSSWGASNLNKNWFKAWDAKNKGFVLVDPGSGAGLDTSLSRAYNRGKGWLGYYWTPSSLMGKYKMVFLDHAVPFDKKGVNCNKKADCKAPSRSANPPSEVYTIVAHKLAESNPQVVNYLKTRSEGDKLLNEVLAWMKEKQATGEQAARYFLKQYPQVWKAWVNKDAEVKILKAL